MKNWSIIINKKPHQIIEHLKEEMAQGSGFVLNVEELDIEHFSFSLRKRIFFGEQILHRNLIHVVGEIKESENEDSSNVEILFKQNPLVVLTKTILFGAGLILLIIGISNSPSFIVPGIILLPIAIILWLLMAKKFNVNSEQYKRLLAELFEIT